jgi:hypothetical protein
MKLEFLQEELENLWKGYELPGGLSVEVVKGEIIIKTDCMISPENGHIVQYDEKQARNQS